MENNFIIYNNLSQFPISFNYRYTECFNCLFQSVLIPNQSLKSISVIPEKSLESKVFLIDSGAQSTICNTSDIMICEDSIANFTVQFRNELDKTFRNKQDCCSLSYSETCNFYLVPFYVLLILACLTTALIYAVFMLYRYRVLQRLGSKLFLFQIDAFEDLGNPRSETSVATDDELDEIPSASPKSLERKRIKGVDTFRGISIMLMIFVNYGGGNYWFMEHSSWNGLTVADLVFPWFVFVMGVTVGLNLFKLTRNLSKLMMFHFWMRAIKRSIILFIIGVALENPKSNLNTLRIMGPLQRLAINYFFITTSIFIISIFWRVNKCRPILDMESEPLYSTSDVTVTENEKFSSRLYNLFPDIIQCFPYILLIFVLLVAHACISCLVTIESIENCPKGYLGPGGIAEFGKYENCTGGVARLIDQLILSDNHMYQTPTCQKIFQTTKPFDPEGFLGILSSSALCLLGFWAGNVMLMTKNWTAIVKRLVIYALICAATGAGLCKGSLNDGFIPINKNLWSVSFVLVTAATSFFLMAIIFFIVDVFHIWSGSPFRYLGMNSILLYVGHEVFRETFPIQWKLSEQWQKHVYQLIMNTWGVCFWTVMAAVLYLKKLFISI